MRPDRSHLVAIAGSVHRPSRSRTLAEAVATLHRIDLRVSTFDLIDDGSGLCAAFSRGELSNEALYIIDAVEQANAICERSRICGRFPADPVAKERIEPAGAQLAALLLQRRRVPSRAFNIRAATAA